MLLDLSKAFDSVNHEFLIDKCIKLKIEPFWFKDFLQNRSQSVRLNDTISTQKAIHYGVPQGAIISPQLFSIFLNDLRQHLQKCFLVQYADDTQIMLTGDIKNIAGLISEAENILEAARSYFQRNGLMLNEKKNSMYIYW